MIAELRTRSLTLATGESSAGRLIGHLLTEVPGSSRVYVGGAVVYHNRLKEAIGVSVQTIEQHGAVSEETAAEMARAVRRWAGTDIGLAETGIAGPKSASEERPAGLFYIAVASADGVVSERLDLDGDRSPNKLDCAERALRLLLRYVREGA